MIKRRSRHRGIARLIAVAVLVSGAAGASAQSPFDDGVRAQMLKRRDGTMAHQNLRADAAATAKLGWRGSAACKNPNASIFESL